jgi:hypothetical protein
MAIFTHSPKSEHIKTVSYDDHSKRLSVTFEHDRQPEPKTYVHGNVPVVAFHSYLRWMKDGQSAGSYYSRFLKRYPIVKDQENKLQ